MEAQDWDHWDSDARMDAELLDMWYGKRSVWFDADLPPVMNVKLSNPAYLDHEQLIYAEAFPWRKVKDIDWREGVRQGIELGIYMP
jgi:hypothetical protein